jgi:hypothetical protein
MCFLAVPRCAFWQRWSPPRSLGRFVSAAPFGQRSDSPDDPTVAYFDTWRT